MTDDGDVSSGVRDVGEHRGPAATDGTLVLGEERGYVGDRVTLHGRNLPAEEAFEVTE